MQKQKSIYVPVDLEEDINKRIEELKKKTGFSVSFSSYVINLIVRDLQREG